MSTLAVTDEVLVEFARQTVTNSPIAVEGNRTRWDVGGPLANGVQLLKAPTGVVEYQPAEMTVQVRAGTTVAELHKVLAEHGQRTSLPERGGTVGGAVAVGENHLEVLGRGSVRNAVLQVRYVAADGQLVTGGGPVVKNVSGFNLPKLIAGSLGVLGSIVEVVLRTNPIPAASRWLQATGVDPGAVRNAVLAPSAVLWDGDTTWVHLEGHLPDLDAETSVLGDLAGFEEVQGPPALPPHRWLVRPQDVSGFSADRFVASVGVGTIWADKPQPARPQDPAVAAVAQRAKALFDPTGRLNPGRSR